ncbi:hypothetical protein VLK31_17050 [Variovorax sp. H27-G14]|uniref:hypothetical protein n=1 Tax=Variovorax sp. H27-G14 TaxID=3111914 RepID=UPI0038FD3B33
MTPLPPPESWRTDPEGRWIDAANTFGHHLMQAARDRAFARIPASATPECRDIARQAALDAIYGVLMLLDGVADSDGVRYALQARVQPADTAETIELAPDGDGLCMGFHGWVAGDFGEPSR